MKAAPALQRGRRSAAVLQQAGVGYHHFSASLRASNKGSGITGAGVASASARLPVLAIGRSGGVLIAIGRAGPLRGRGGRGASGDPPRAR